MSCNSSGGKGGKAAKGAGSSIEVPQKAIEQRLSSIENSQEMREFLDPKKMNSTRPEFVKTDLDGKEISANLIKSVLEKEFDGNLWKQGWEEQGKAYVYLNSNSYRKAYPNESLPEKYEASLNYKGAIGVDIRDGKFIGRKPVMAADLRYHAELMNAVNKKILNIVHGVEKPSWVTPETQIYKK